MNKNVITGICLLIKQQRINNPYINYLIAKIYANMIKAVESSYE